MADLYGLDAQAAQVRARLREGESLAFIVRIGDHKVMSESGNVELMAHDGVGVGLYRVHMSRPDKTWESDRIEDAFKEALAWLEKRDAEGGR